jgi:hypothetical protein
MGVDREVLVGTEVQCGTDYLCKSNGDNLLVVRMLVLLLLMARTYGATFIYLLLRCLAWPIHCF